jgi:hypothetical protein
MIKATTTTPEGRTLLLIGLSFGNLDRFRAEPGETYINIDGKEMGLPIDIVLFSGESEAHLQEMVASAVTAETIVHIDPRLRS